MRIAPSNQEMLAPQTHEFAEDLAKPSLGQKRTNGVGNASSLFLWAEIFIAQDFNAAQKHDYLSVKRFRSTGAERERLRRSRSTGAAWQCLVIV